MEAWFGGRVDDCGVVAVSNSEKREDDALLGDRLNGNVVGLGKKCFSENYQDAK